MEEKTRNMAGFVSWISGLCMILGSASSPAPTVTHCELLEHANITCYWTAVSSEGTSYKLSVNMTYCLNYTNYMPMGSCYTTRTHCSVNIGSVSHCFCVDVLASSPSETARSARHCLIGINEVKMYPPRITKLVMIPMKAHCLKLEWTEDIYLQSEKDHSILQIEYNTPHQDRSWTVSTALHNWQMELCGLYPGTQHYVRVRAQNSRAPKHWSSWSAVREATTAEAAPSTAPELWRHIQPVDERGQRHITLLWKPLLWPDSNGVIQHYSASCWSDLDRSHWDCHHLDSSSMSCILHVSAHPCTCNLTASNSAGTSPSAHVRIPGDGGAVLPPPADIRVTPLDDFQLKVDWTAAVDQSEASFVVEWFPIPNNTADDLYWKILNGSARSFVVADGILPEVPYNVSVRILYRKAVGFARFAVAFTRQGAPSVGPTVEVLQIASNHVTLKWEAVPLEKLRGFIQNYTILYKTNGKVKSRVLGGHVKEYSLSGLSAGEYAICVKAHTEAGGAAGPWVTVAVGNDYFQLVAILLCAVGTLLVLVILLSQVERIQQRLCPAVPDPSKSSLSTWPPVSQSQHKLTVLDFKPSPSLFELIYVGGKSGHWDHHHQNHSQVSALSYQAVPIKSASHESKSLAIFERPVAANPDKREAEQPLSEPNAEDLSDHLTADLDYKGEVVTALPSCLQTQVSFSYPTVSESYLGMDVVGSPLCRVCVSRFDSCSQIHVSSRCSSDPESFLGVDAVDLVYKRNFKSRLESTCCPFVSTSYLPVPDSYANIGVEAEDSTNLIQRSNHLSGLEPCCYTHVSTTYLPVPKPSLAYADFVMETVDTTEHLHQSSLMSKMQSNSYTCVPLGTKAVESSSNQRVCQSSPVCTNLKMVDTYRLLGPDERPRLLPFSLQKHSTGDASDLVGL
ncbi:interleukin-31 receptor subunit alpha isoform X1 [Colossoma macropomum]|uniref:interleukin-31 receptor subunit alpha isoform X1 n=1 Tax=Colossoma macropomum TaxID=42526 RepID=UPI0018655D38|nr:interleukin-31 receptor subunit alpha isoform X1 [Colossoma macropomum]